MIVERLESHSEMDHRMSLTDAFHWQSCFEYF